ncbi:MAG: flagellar biosynthesis protein FlgA [Opitutus sp.]|nr:flagellar biosynthesis protein FlgA [Opitutus sp.]
MNLTGCFCRPTRSTFQWALAVACVLFGSTAALHAARVKDLTIVEGGRDNQLVGYGLVVGLAGEGDSNAASTLRSIQNTLQRYGISVNQQDIKAKNVAAVMITADIAAFLKPGGRIDVLVASMGDAKTLQGGVLLQTPLLGADGRTYAVAQGPVAIGGFFGGSGGAGGATVQKNHPTVGNISNGAIIEREIPAQFVHEETLRLLLHNPDFTSAARMADAINLRWPDAIAQATDAATVAVKVPEDYKLRHVAFLADLGTVELQPDTMARIVINERTGTIVATSTVRVSHVAIAHGALTITVTNNQGVSQPGAFSGGTTQQVQSTQTAVNETKGGFTVLNEPPTIERLAAALNALGVSTRDMMAIFQSLKRSGALQAELVIN